MKTYARRIRLVAAALAAVGLVLPLAAAAKTVTTHEHDSATFEYDVPDLCPFTIHVDSLVTFNNTTRIVDGVTRQFNAHVVERSTLTANGISIPTEPFSYNFRQTFDATGALVDFWNTGVTFTMLLPDGTRFHTAGRFNWSDHPGASYIVVPDSGRSADVAVLCAAFTP
jgi:hypothetical protein